MVKNAINKQFLHKHDLSYNKIRLSDYLLYLSIVIYLCILFCLYSQLFKKHILYNFKIILEC